MSYSLNFYLDRTNGNPKSTDYKKIYYYITWQGDRIRKSTKEKCRQCDWIDEESKKGRTIKVQRVNTAFEYALKINSRLSDIEYKVEKFFEHCYKEKVIPTRYEVEEVISGEKIIKEDLEFKPLFNKFIEDSRNGARLTKQGKRIEYLTIRSYEHTLNILEKFEEKKKYKLVWKNINDTFYSKLTSYMWDDLNYYDNAVGSIIKVVRVFLNWSVDTEKAIKEKPHNEKWKVWEEEIDIIVLYPDELNILFNNDPPSEAMIKNRDRFLAGCMTCLRVSNLLSLKKQELSGNKLSIVTVKGENQITLEVSPLLKRIFDKYKDQYETLLPPISDQKFNEGLKDLAKWFKKFLNDNKGKLKENFIGNDWNNEFLTTRRKRGKAIRVPVKMENMISSHTMRRTGITNLLMMGLTEIEVKAISGHSFASNDFAKYVKIAEQFISKKSNDAWSKIEQG